MENQRLIYKDEFGETHTVDYRIDGKIIGDKAVREKLFEYEQEDSEGRLIHLPCKIGSVVYEMVLNRDKSFSHWNTHKVVGVHLGNFPDIRGHKRQEYLVTHLEVLNYLGRIPLNKLGKTVFLTPEEAEKALKEQNNEHKCQS